jgi:hypothetical protein
VAQRVFEKMASLELFVMQLTLDDGGVEMNSQLVYGYKFDHDKIGLGLENVSLVYYENG